MAALELVGSHQTFLRLWFAWSPAVPTVGLGLCWGCFDIAMMQTIPWKCCWQGDVLQGGRCAVGQLLPCRAWGTEELHLG